MKRCKECNSLFTPTRSWMVFCSEACREVWYKKDYLFWKAKRRKALAGK